MIKIKNIKTKLIIAISAIALFAGSMAVLADKPVFVADTKLETTKLEVSEKTVPAPEPKVEFNEKDYACVKPLQVVDNPSVYLNKKVKFTAAFDKFSVLGLDYKPAFRDSQKYITFLIKRDDVTDHTIPLSEMKIFIKRTEAEKFIELDSGDIIEVYGNVFSDALTDAWVEVDKLVIVKKFKKEVSKKA